MRLEKKTVTLPFSKASEQQFYSDLTAAINREIAGIYHTKIMPITYPSQGDLMWYYQNSNQIFNEDTFNYISARVSPGRISVTAQISPASGFLNAYIQVISGIRYVLSQADQTKLNNALSNVQDKAQSIISTYQAIFGEITDEDIKIAQSKVGFSVVKAKIDYVISYVLGYQWSDRQEKAEPPLTYKEMANARNLKELLPKIPASGDSLITEVSTYLDLMQPINALQSEVQMGNWIISQLRNNTLYPDKHNGGMKTINPNTGEVSTNFKVGYSISRSLASIQNDLNNKQRIIKVNITVSENSQAEMIATIANTHKFSVGSVIRFSRDSFDYDMHTVQGISKDSSIMIEYQGYTMVSIAPLAWQQATNIGWYYADPIAEAYKNSNQDVTGFKFISQPRYNLKSLAEGGNFGQLTNLLISNYPTVTIHYRNADFKKFKQSWDETVKGNLTLFGFTSLGRSTKGRYSSKIHQGSSNSEFSVTFSASPEVSSVPQLQQTAYVIGGSFDFPAMSTSESSKIRRIIAQL